MKSPITTHVLDTSTGKPASGVSVTLEVCESDTWSLITEKSTNEDGRVMDLLPHALEAKTYRLTFAILEYFARTKRESFFPKVVIEFTISNLEQHYHVPLLLSPFGYSTYRGS